MKYVHNIFFQPTLAKKVVNWTVYLDLYIVYMAMQICM